MRHRFAVWNWLRASFRLAQVVAHHTARAGPAVRAHLSTGEVVATVTNDCMRAGGAFDITARLAGAVAAYGVVAVILLSSSMTLGLVVLVGVPLLVLVLGTVIKPLQTRQRVQREEVGKLTALGADTAAGLRVLRGIGGEQAFFDRYRHRSQEVRRAGVRVALPQSTLDAAQVLVPGLFVVLVTWLGAHFALDGTIGAGELVAFYGYAAFLVIPLRTAAEAVDKITRAFVGARRMLDVLGSSARSTSRRSRARARRTAYRSSTRARGSSSSRAGSRRSSRRGRKRRPRSPTGSAASDKRDGVMLGDVRDRRSADRRPAPPDRRQRGRSRALLGPLRGELDPWKRASDEEILDAVSIANAEDVLDALPERLDAEIDERGRSFSGGQRQRLVLVRALLSQAETLVLVEPTSAVDAHTEARIARRLHEARAGKTTVVVTTSPLLLDQADTVVYVEDGRVVAEGGHRELLRDNAAYRETVTRGEDE